MKPQAQRIAIAEACGWSDIQEPIMFSALMPTPAGIAPNETDRLFSTIPDYLNSLDAMVAAEAIIGDAETQIRYAANVLIEMGFPDLYEAHDLNVDYCWHALGASPKERAKAFLRTLNLWTE